MAEATTWKPARVTSAVRIGSVGVMSSARKLRSPLTVGLLLMAASLVGKACVFGDPVVEDQVGPPLDVALSAGEVRAGEITRSSELIRGISARGRIGDFKLYNDKVAVVIAAAGASRGYHPYGGVVLDASPVDENGRADHSAFGEVIIALDLSVLRATDVEVINDGADGNAARIRVTGGPDIMPLFDSLLSEFLESRPADMDWSVDYVLEPSSSVVRLEFGVKNLGRATLDFGLRIAAFMFSTGSEPFLEGFGFDPPSGGVTAPYYAALGDDVSYAYGSAEDRTTLLVSASGVVATGLGDGFELIARDTFAYTHYLVIGDGNMSRTQALWRETVGEAPGHEVVGLVRDRRNVPIAGARVHATQVAPTMPDRDYVARAVTDAEGRYRLTLLEGDYRLLVSTDAGVRSTPREIAVGAPMMDVDLEVDVQSTLEYRVVDTDGVPLPVKLSIRRTSEAIQRLPARYGEPIAASGLHRTVFAHEGEGVLALAPGSYEIIASRGNEYEIYTDTTSIAANASATFEGELVRSVETFGWMSTDTHIHAQLSPDSPDLYPFKVRTMVVENLELPISTEHEAIGDFNPAIEALGLERFMQGIVGSEITTFTYGHFNAFPMVPNSALPGNGRIDWYNVPPAETFKRIHDNPGDPFIQVNHPRSASVGGYFSAMGFDSEAYTVAREDEWSLDFEGIEVLNGCGNGTIEQAPIRDWFRFLNQGVRKIGAASTDNHKASSGNMGYPRTYVKMPTDDPPSAKVEDLRSAFKAGRLTMSCGPFLTARIGRAQIGDTVHAETSQIQVIVYLAAPTWMDVDALDVIVDGKIQSTVALEQTDDPVRFRGTVTATVTPGRPGWVAVSARGDRRHGVWASGRPSFALTNPIFLE